MKPIPEIVNLPERFFTGLQARFVSACSPEATNMEVIPKLWSEFVPRMHEAAAIEPEISYGLCACPEFLGLTPAHPHEAVYLAAMRTTPGARAPDGMVVWASAAGLHAKFNHHGPVAKIGETMGFIYGEWLRTAGFDHAPAPDIERYDARFDPIGEQSVLEIFIPVRAKETPPGD